MGKIADSYEFTEDTVLIASWIPKTYTITFDVSGGTGSVDSMSVTYGSTFIFPTYTGTKQGFVFAGWNLQENQATGTPAGSTSLPVTGNATYYAVWVSDEGVINPDLSQRKIVRHASNEGSIVEINVYGKSTYLFVADAQYRGEAAYRTNPSDIPELPNLNLDFKYVNPADTSDVSTEVLTYTVSDRELQNRFESLAADKSAKENTDILMQYEDTEAAHLCRSVDIGSLGKMDLPNVYEVSVLYIESDRIDALDPTVGQYPQYALGTANTNGRFGFSEYDIWSSTENSNGDARYVSDNGSSSYGGKEVSRGVVPVLELSTHTVTFDTQGGSTPQPEIIVPKGHNFTYPYYNGVKDGFAFAGWSTQSGQTSGELAGGKSGQIHTDTTYYACWRAVSVNPNLDQRVLYRHASDEGSVVVLDMYGRPTFLFVPDSKYRTAFKNSWGSVGFDVPELDNFRSDVKNINPSGTSDERNEPLGYTMSDKQLQQRFSTFATDKSARENTDILMQYEDTSAAHYCRDLDVTGVGKMDLPTIYQLSVIYMEADRLDALDPTVATNKKYALGMTNTFGRFDLGDVDFVWSSTEYDSDHTLCVNAAGAVNDADKYNLYGIIPVSELQGEHCVVNFNVDGGSGEVVSIFVEKGKTIKFPSYTGTKEGFTFGGWNASQGSNTGSTAGQTSEAVYADMTYYAVWIADHTVTFNVDGGSENVDPIKVKHNQTFQFPEYSGTKDGFEFMGWSLEQGQESGSESGTTSQVVTSDLTYYACWKATIVAGDPNLPQRVLERHPSGQGTVVTFDMYGETVKLFVADAKYRATNKRWGTYETDIPTMDNFTADSKYINPSDKADTDTADLSYALTDTQLQARFPSFKTDKTAKQNTDILMGYADTAAAKHCRDQNISGVGRMDLPNIYELMVLYLESDRIDALDPTVSSYPQYALGKKNTDGRFGSYVWSSTEYSDIYARGVHHNGYVDYGNENNTDGVVPVLEL